MGKCFAGVVQGIMGSVVWWFYFHVFHVSMMSESSVSGVCGCSVGVLWMLGRAGDMDLDIQS